MNFARTHRKDEIMKKKKTELKEVFNFIDNELEKVHIQAVKMNWQILRHIERQTRDICLAAIETDYRAIQHVINQTYELCLIAARKNPKALKFIRNWDYRICCTNAIYSRPRKDEQVITVRAESEQ